jgi:O-antigen ligase
MKPKLKNNEVDLTGRASARSDESAQHRSSAPAAASEERVRHWLLAGFMAICIGRPLVPSEGVAWLGDGHSFTILLLILTAVYFLTVIQRRALQRPLQLIDWALAVLVMICVSSSMLGIAATKWHVSDALEIAGRKSSPRLAVNMIWEWIGLGLVFFLARQLIVTSREKRAVAALMVALAVVVAAFGIYQIQVTLPEQRAAYAANPDETLREIGQWFPLGSPERDRFEARLASPEPLATFALTNSLAGFLVAWLIVALGIAWNLFANRRQSLNGVTMLRFAGLVAMLALILACLVLTRSRSAYLALAVGVLLLPLVAQVWKRAIPWKGLGAAGAVLLLVGGGLFAALGGSERALLTDAGKSFDYRLEYWESTLDMIGAFPILGVGPGEFQNYYTMFKLPQASEEIRDPHNFLLEVWATGGTLAFLALVALLAALALFVWDLKPPQAAPSAAVPREAPDDVWLLMLGAAAGFPLAYVAGLPFGFSVPPVQLVLGLAIGALAVGILWGWIVGGELAPRLPALGVLVLAIHWLAAGGLTFPGVAGSFWLLIALTMNQPIDAVHAIDPAAQRGRRLVPTLALLACLLALVAHYSSAFLPVLKCRAEMARAANLRLTDEVRFESLLNAVRADPLSSEPWQVAAQLSARRLAENPGDGKWQHRLITAVGSVAKLESQNSAIASACADMFREVYVTNPDLKLAQLIVNYRRAAAGLYPNSAVVQGAYALSLETAEKPEAARRAAARALELDELTPHADKKLPQEMRKQLEQLGASEKGAAETREAIEGVEANNEAEKPTKSKDAPASEIQGENPSSADPDDRSPRS